MEALPALMLRAWMAEVALVLAVTMLCVMLATGGGAKLGKALVWPLVVVAIGIAANVLNPFRPQHAPMDPEAAAFAYSAPQAAKPTHIGTRRHAAPPRPYCFRVLTDPSQSNC
jgi:hypothetical protein